MACIALAALLGLASREIRASADGGTGQPSLPQHPHGRTRARASQAAATLDAVPEQPNPGTLTYAASGSAARAAITAWSHRNVTSGFKDPYGTPNHDCTYTIDDAHVDDGNTRVFITLTPR
jgi:hypothetical protein